ncbi:hypothetical protein [Nocardioides sambongensis]|uniref:hypothetical protein n=1 Tax=Nocardioides sambongensis TaxID=2589074 RepID=UPI00112C7DC6|nr:hypothetical protein [Nocardioides sambongensis]
MAADLKTSISTAKRAAKWLEDEGWIEKAHQVYTGPGSTRLAKEGEAPSAGNVWRLRDQDEVRRESLTCDTEGVVTADQGRVVTGDQGRVVTGDHQKENLVRESSSSTGSHSQATATAAERSRAAADCALVAALSALPRRVRPRPTAKVVEVLSELEAAGWTVPDLREHLADLGWPESATPGLAVERLRDLRDCQPPERAAEPPDPSARCEVCGQTDERRCRLAGSKVHPDDRHAYRPVGLSASARTTDWELPATRARAGLGGVVRGGSSG